MEYLAIAVLFAAGAAAHTSDIAHIERKGDSAILSVNTFRPLEAISIALEEQFGIPVRAEDPVFRFRGDMLDMSLEAARIRPGTLVPARGDLRYGSR